MAINFKKWKWTRNEERLSSWTVAKYLCNITPTHYWLLLLFMKHRHITDCYYYLWNTDTLLIATIIYETPTHYWLLLLFMKHRHITDCYYYLWNTDTLLIATIIYETPTHYWLLLLFMKHRHITDCYYYLWNTDTLLIATNYYLLFRWGDMQALTCVLQVGDMILEVVHLSFVVSCMY